MIRALILTLVLAGCASTPVRETAPLPRAESQTECILYGDVALVARAMVIEGLDGAVRHRMYVAIYQNVLDGLQPRKREAVMTVIAAIDDTAIKFSGSPPIFGSMLAQVCLRGGGNLGTILGTAI